MTIRLTLWSAPGHLSVTSWLGPSKESTSVPEPGEKSTLFDGTIYKKKVFRGNVELSPLFSAVGPLSHLVILSRSARSISRPVAKAAANKAKLPAHLMCVKLCIIGRFQCYAEA